MSVLSGRGIIVRHWIRYMYPDFHFHVSFTNLLSTFDAFIDEGLSALKALRRSTPHG